MTIPPSGNGLVGLLFNWRIDRADKSYRVFVVEPPFLEPAAHTSIFNAAISRLLVPATPPVSDLAVNTPLVERFDLVTFPEAFLPAADLVTVVRGLAGVERLGCVHVGLRPDTSASHLFSTFQLQTLVKELSAVTEVFGGDIAKFRKWLSKQKQSDRFNVACLFAVDAKARIRICLHPKMVRSKFEASALPEEDMTSANVLSLVTLIPSDPNLLTITVQPLICSDALEVDTDYPGHLPIQAVNTSAISFGCQPPRLRRCGFHRNVYASDRDFRQTKNVAAAVPGCVQPGGWSRRLSTSRPCRVRAFKLLVAWPA
jgi:hypothetical protein